jgi:hypothetical protein
MALLGFQRVPRVVDGSVFIGSGNYDSGTCCAVRKYLVIYMVHTSCCITARRTLRQKPAALLFLLFPVTVSTPCWEGSVDRL